MKTSWMSLGRKWWILYFVITNDFCLTKMFWVSLLFLTEIWDFSGAGPGNYSCPTLKECHSLYKDLNTLYVDDFQIHILTKPFLWAQNLNIQMITCYLQSDVYQRSEFRSQSIYNRNHDFFRQTISYFMSHSPS